MRTTARFIALLGMLAALNLAAESVFEVIELRHRTPQELVPLLQPLVEPEGTVGAAGSKLVVRASPAQLRELRKLVQQLDTAPRQLLVTVRQGSQDDSTTRASGLAGKGKFGDVTVDVPPTTDPSLPGVGVATPDAEIEWRGGTRKTRGNNNADQQLRVMDGREAVIYVGQAVPYRSKSVSPYGYVTEHTQLREVLTGFVVRPQVQGDRVTLDISPQQESLTGAPGGSISVNRLSTSISGKLGEWIDLGAVTQQASTESSGNFSLSKTDSTSTHQVLIKVEIIP